MFCFPVFNESNVAPSNQLFSRLLVELYKYRVLFKNSVETWDLGIGRRESLNNLNDIHKCTCSQWLSRWYPERHLSVNNNFCDACKSIYWGHPRVTVCIKQRNADKSSVVFVKTLLTIADLGFLYSVFFEL